MAAGWGAAGWDCGGGVRYHRHHREFYPFPLPSSSLLPLSIFPFSLPFHFQPPPRFQDRTKPPTNNPQSYLYDNNDQFIIPGWSLDSSWLLCTVSASLSAACALALASSYYLLPREGGYEFLPDTDEGAVS
ncbi:hypothetical protein IMZ48_26380 [Candidatus Bathyarchaeota archaeon]|nr:hypothetical protein [Candidatus Bathyarchaeota archaeon]